MTKKASKPGTSIIIACDFSVKFGAQFDYFFNSYLITVGLMVVKWIKDPEETVDNAP